MSFRLEIKGEEMRLYKDFKEEQERIRQEAEDRELLQKEVVIIYEQKGLSSKIKVFFGFVFSGILLLMLGLGVGALVIFCLENGG